MVIVTAVVAVVKARSVRNSRKTAFTFNFSPPFLFFHPEVLYIGTKRKKPYGIDF